MFISVRLNSKRIKQNLQMILAGLFVFCMLISNLHAADDVSYGFKKRVLKDETGEHKYVVYIPMGYDPNKKSPVILYLHGGGERGTDGVKPAYVGIGKAIQKLYKDYPYITVFPQCEDVDGPILSGWSANRPDGKRAMKILEAVEKEFSTDSSRRFLTGWSMGGYGAWSLAAAYPDHWKSVVLLSGGGDPALAEKVKDVPFWIIHGADDGAVRVEESQEIVDALEKVNGKFHYTVIPLEQHDTWETVYLRPELYEWMENPTFDESPNLAIFDRIQKVPGETTEGIKPFTPAIEVPDAITVRIGNKILDMLSHQLPSMIPSNALSGSIPDIYDTSTTSGRTFQVRFSGITYTGQITNATVKAYRQDRINIQVALSNVQLNIGRTYVNGSGRSAVTGPILISFGHAGPVWLSFDVTPYIQGKQIKLRHAGTNFQIPPGNFSVSPPRGVSVSGFGMTEERVSSSLVSGIYSKRSRIEQEISSVIPNILPQFEKNLDFAKSAPSMDEYWFLPVYKPEIRFWPSYVDVDSTGISLRMGLSAQSFNIPKKGESPKIVNVLKEGDTGLPKEDRFQLGLAPKLLSALTQLLIDDGVARIHFSDIPGKKFDSFSNPSVMSEIIPELKKYGDQSDLWAVLSLESTLDVYPVEKPENARIRNKTVQPVSLLESDTEVADSTNEVELGAADEVDLGAIDVPGEDHSLGQSKSLSSADFAYSVPKAQILISVASPENPTKRINVAKFSLSISQESELSLIQPSYSSRAFQLNWTGEPKVKIEGGFVDGYQAENPDINIESMEKLFLEGWNEWSRSGKSHVLPLSDLVIGGTAFRLNEIEWEGPYLVTELNSPGVRITNDSEVPVDYEMRTPTSSWGGPYTIKPGKSHFFDVNRPMKYRMRDGGQIIESYTLPVGSHSDFRILKGKEKPSLYNAE